MHNIHTYIARLAIVVFQSLLYIYELAVYYVCAWLYALMLLTLTAWVKVHSVLEIES